MRAGLKGQKVLVTRAAHQAQAFSKQIIRNGGISYEIPLLEVVCKQEVWKDMDTVKLMDYDWIFFTSVNGAHCFFNHMESIGFEMERFASQQFAAVGHKTEAVLQAYDFKADFVPTLYNAETMANEFLQQFEHPGKVLFIRGNRSRNTLLEEFSKAGLSYDSLEIYDTDFRLCAKQELEHAWNTVSFDYITFTSPSAVDAFYNMLETTAQQHHEPVCVCIGTTTEKRAKYYGFQRIIYPQQFTIDDMIDCMISYNERK